MEEIKHNKFFRFTGLTIWSFALMANVSIIAKQIEIDTDNSPTKIPSINIRHASELNQSKTSAGRPAIISLKTPSIPELPPSPNNPKIKYYNLIIERASVLYRIDPDLIRAMIMVESRYKVKVTSGKSAKGLMQIIPSTAAELGVRNIFEPEENILAGAKYIRYLLGRFEGDVELALAAYNAGYRKVIEHNGLPPFPETQGYVENVFKYYTYYKIESLRQGRITIE